jgi:hypothetical protein
LRGVDQRFGKDIVFLDVSELLASNPHEVHVSYVIFRFDQSILPDSVALVSPHSGETFRITLVDAGYSLQHVLNNLGEISQVELIMELSSSGHELRRVGHLHEHSHGSFNDPGSKVRALLVEGYHVVLKDLQIDLSQHFSFGSQTGNKSQMSGKTSINEEGTRLGVHGTEEHSSLDESLLLKSLSVVDKLVIDNLSNQRDGSLGLILISLGHVKIIQEVDQNLTGRRTVVLTSLFEDLRLKQSLQGLGVSVGVERHTG